MDNENLQAAEQPDSAAENLENEQQATTPDTALSHSEQEGLTLKFNKKEQKIPYDEAVALAQKGLKYENILPEFSRLKALARKSGKSIADYLTAAEESALGIRKAELLAACGGNEEAASKLLMLENAENPTGELVALRREFPEINSLSELPEGVKELCDSLGLSPLNGLLLYNHRKARIALETVQKQQAAYAQSVGSQNSHPIKDSGEDDFIRGLWS